jgi:excinuclease UvrABC nuclease subunit
MYGEMNMCLRPCQAAVTDREYASEVARLENFLGSAGASMLDSIAAARDRSSEELDFEEAARQHKLHERVQNIVGLRDELACDVDRLSGIAITPATDPETVTLWFMMGGRWTDPVEFPLGAPGSGMVPLDRRLRQVVEGIEAPRVTAVERQEHLALLARWYYSSWRDGEWLPFDGLERLPYRKSVNAIGRIARAAR